MPEPKRPSEIFARHLRLTREERRMSQADLATKIGTSKTTVLRTESGQREVSLDEALALAAVLDLTLAQLLDDDGPVAVAPGYVANTSEVQRWLAGQRPLPGQDCQRTGSSLIEDDNRAQLELALRLVWGFVAALEKGVQALVSAVIREDRIAVADAVDGINAQVGHSREGGIEGLFEDLRGGFDREPNAAPPSTSSLADSLRRQLVDGEIVEPLKPSRRTARSN